MVDNVLLNSLLEYLKHKDVLSDLEKDLLSTIEEYIKIPFDRTMVMEDRLCGLRI